MKLQIGSCTYPTTPTMTIGGVSMTVTASTISFLCILAPGRSKSRTIWDIPAYMSAEDDARN